MLYLLKYYYFEKLASGSVGGCKSASHSSGAGTVERAVHPRLCLIMAWEVDVCDTEPNP